MNFLLLILKQRIDRGTGGDREFLEIGRTSMLSTVLLTDNSIY